MYIFEIKVALCLGSMCIEFSEVSLPTEPTDGINWIL